MNLAGATIIDDLKLFKSIFLVTDLAACYAGYEQDSSGHSVPPMT